MRKRVILLILDGLGVSSETDYNAYYLANTPTFDRIMEICPNTLLSASGKAVGLPHLQPGNSKIGHTIMGAGRVIPQELERINLAIETQALKANGKIKKLCENTDVAKNYCHIIGLLSDGGVHSHISHIIELIDILIPRGVKVKLHIIADGRDVQPRSVRRYLDQIIALQKRYGLESLSIATFGGRYYAMDRDSRLDRTESAYNAIMFGTSKEQFLGEVGGVLSFVDRCYAHNIDDEFMMPATNVVYKGVLEGDSLIVANFRSDRIRQLLNRMFIPDSTSNRSVIDHASFSVKLGMISYSEILDRYLEPILAIEKCYNTLAEVLAKHGKTQLRVSETEKYAHVTFFFNCGIEELLPGEDRVLIPSPKVATYDQAPRMSADAIVDVILQNQNRYDFICANLANADMIGHTGQLDVAIKACEVLDECLEVIIENLDDEVDLLVTSDHGNIEKMYNDFQPCTSHTNNPVPFILINNHYLKRHLPCSNLLRRPDCGLQDIAPTVLFLLGIQKPLEMTGISLIS